MGFKLRSGNTTGFKNMGSSPAKQGVPTPETMEERKARLQKEEEENEYRKGVSTLETEEERKARVRREEEEAQPGKGVRIPSKKESPAKQVKEVKGTSIFGKSPKDFVKSLLINQVAPGAEIIAKKVKKVKKAYDTYKGAKEGLVTGGLMGNKGKKGVSVMDSDPTIPQHEVVHPTMGLKKKGKKLKKSKKKRVSMQDPDSGGFMRPPYKVQKDLGGDVKHYHGFKKKK